MTDANGLYYLRARYYDPDIKRFVNADTYKGKINDSTTLNNYAYANGNPVTLTDPFGKCADGSLNSWGSNLPTWVKLLIGGAVIAALAVATVLTGGIAGAICAAALTGAVVGGATGATIGLVMSTIDGKSISATCNSMADGFMWGTISGGATGAAGEGLEIAGSAAEATEEAGNANRVFWPGGDIAKDAAQKYAINNGATTLEMTSEGINLTEKTSGMAWNEAKPLWEQASYNFAQGAKGEVTVFQRAEGVSMESIWANTEYKALLSNPEVTGINYKVIMPDRSIRSFMLHI